MPRRKGRKGSRGGGGGLLKPKSRMGYQNAVKVSANQAISVSTTGAAFYGITPFGAGSGTQFTPYANGTNYATLSQWGDFRCSKIELTVIAQVGSAGDPLQFVAALDSTGGDIAGGSVTGAYNTIMSRQTAKRAVVTPSQQRPVKMVFRPVELQNRLWNKQSDLAAGSGFNEPWGVLFATFCPASSTTITLYIDWYFDVREPTLSGVLIGKESVEERLRLERIASQALPRPRPLSSTQINPAYEPSSTPQQRASPTGAAAEHGCCDKCGK